MVVGVEVVVSSLIIVVVIVVVIAAAVVVVVVVISDIPALWVSPLRYASGVHFVTLQLNPPPLRLPMGEKLGTRWGACT